MASYIVYILKLEQDKYYVGKTQDLDNRLVQHKTGNGSAWTRKYPVIELIDSIENCNAFDEDKYVKMYMDEYGIDNVRGGSYTMIELPDEQVNCLKKELLGNSDCCFFCGQPGHFVRYCPNKKSKRNNVKKLETKKDSDDNIFSQLIDQWILVGNENEEKGRATNKSKKYCKRCFRFGHNKKTCYAKTNIRGEQI